MCFLFASLDTCLVHFLILFVRAKRKVDDNGFNFGLLSLVLLLLAGDVLGKWPWMCFTLKVKEVSAQKTCVAKDQLQPGVGKVHRCGSGSWQEERAYFVGCRTCRTLCSAV